MKRQRILAFSAVLTAQIPTPLLSNVGKPLPATQRKERLREKEKSYYYRWEGDWSQIETGRCEFRHRTNNKIAKRKEDACLCTYIDGYLLERI
jgi:hypothetical protein